MCMYMMKIGEIVTLAKKLAFPLAKDWITKLNPLSKILDPFPLSVRHVYFCQLTTNNEI